MPGHQNSRETNTSYTYRTPTCPGLPTVGVVGVVGGRYSRYPPPTNSTYSSVLIQAPYLHPGAWCSSVLLRGRFRGHLRNTNRGSFNQIEGVLLTSRIISIKKHQPSRKKQKFHSELFPKKEAFVHYGLNLLKEFLY